MRLIITRHAKSSWDNPGLTDHDRPLSKRGRNSSDAIGKWLADHGYIPKIVLCSTSKRTSQTWQRMEYFMPHRCEVRYESELYHGSTNAFFNKLAKTQDSPVLILGHNPGIGYFAESLLHEPPNHPHFWRYPTAATLVCDAPVDHWRELRPATCDLVDFVVPRDLI